MRYDLNDIYLDLGEIKEAIDEVKVVKRCGKNPTDINFAHMGNQVAFIDSIKYFQQSLGTLANTMTDDKKLAIKKECKNLF